MTGFYRKPLATGEVLRNGWLHTGDLGRIDEDGYLFVTGRKRKMIIVKGQNIFPEDIEGVLAGHPKIASAKVVGIPDIIRGETVKAIIRPEAGATVTEAEVRQFCQDRLASHKLPREIVFTGVLPEAISLWSRREERAPVQLVLK